MRLAVVAGYPPNPSGEAHYSGQAFSTLAALYPEIDIIVYAHSTPDAPAEERLRSNLRIVRRTKPGGRIAATISILQLLVHLLLSRPSVVHLQGTHTPLYGGLWGEPTTLMVLILRLFGIPSILSVHATWMPENLDKFAHSKGLGSTATKLLRWYYRSNFRLLARKLSFMNIVTAGDQSFVADAFASSWGLDQTRIVDEPHPCNFDPISLEAQGNAKAALGLADNRILLCLGFVRPDKGYHVLAECADAILERHNDAVIIIAGQPRGADGQRYAATLNDMRNRSKHKLRIILRFEYLSDRDLEALFCAADVVVIPYLRVIGPSGPVHHAMGRGKPIIASKLGHNLGLADVCKLTDPGDSDALRLALDEMLLSPDELSHYRKLSIEFAQQHTWAHLAERYQSQYQSLVARDPEPPSTTSDPQRS